MFTTAGSTRVTIDENELAAGIGSGKPSGLALVPANVESVFIADTLPLTTDPIKMPTARVSTTDKDARIFLRRVQADIPLTSSISFLLLCPQKTPRPPVQYNTAFCPPRLTWCALCTHN